MACKWGVSPAVVAGINMAAMRSVQSCCPTQHESAGCLSRTSCPSAIAPHSTCNAHVCLRRYGATTYWILFAIVFAETGACVRNLGGWRPFRLALQLRIVR